MNLDRRSVPAVLMTAAGSVLGGLSAAAALLRHGKPLHPEGTVYDALLRRTGTARRWGSAWLDEMGEDRGLVRLSRAVGLPAAVPDILGLALTFDGPDGARHDLLLATTGLGPVTRFVLLPRQDPFGVAYTCLLPYATPHGPVVMAATPVAGSPLEAAHPTFRMLAASPGGPWLEFGRLELTARASAEPDLPLRFDPILNPLPDLGWYRALTRLREPAYAAARRLGAAASPTSGPLDADARFMR
jgi:hypothetical protein